MTTQARNWTNQTTVFLPGDMVNTEHGLAIITQAERRDGLDAYAVWHLPGAQAVSPVPGVSIPPRSAWFNASEVQLVQFGHASFLRDLDNQAPINKA